MFLFNAALASHLIFLTLVLLPADSRKWTTPNDSYSIRGAMVAFNETTVIIKRDRPEKLFALEIKDLSEADQEYISAERRRRESENLNPNDGAGDWQTWTTASGWQIRGRVLAYGRKDLVIERNSRVAVVNGKSFSNLDALQQRVILATLSQLENQELKSEQDFTKFVSQLKGQPKTYTLDGVMFQLESGDKVPVPFFLFSEKDQSLLRAGWENWMAAEQDETARNREDFLVRQEALRYQAMQQREAQYQQMEILKLNLLASATGLTSIWEVALIPGRGVWGRPTTVIVSARTSQVAAQTALQSHPGYVVGPIRRVSGL